MTSVAEISAPDAPAIRTPPVRDSAELALLSIVVPTFNERDNVRELVARLDRCLAGVAWEVVFVDDDSRDGTLDLLREVSRADARVRFLHRIGRRRRRAGNKLPDRCCDGLRSPARRDPAAEDARRIARTRLRCGCRIPL